MVNTQQLCTMEPRAITDESEQIKKEVIYMMSKLVDAGFDPGNANDILSHLEYIPRDQYEFNTQSKIESSIGCSTESRY